ncbi:Crp/Fnr family transcriptional regulator [Flavobacterium hauense]
METLAALFDKIGLQTHHLDDFEKELKILRVKKREYLIREGSVCDFIAFVHSGTLRSYVQNDEEEFNNDFYFEGSFVSAYTSFLTRMPTNCNIEVLADAEISVITHKQFNALITNDSEYLKLGKYISDDYFIRKCKRETSFLKNSASERLEVIRSLYPGIEQKVSQYHIASYMGIKPESLSRIKTLNLHQ